MSRLPDKMFKKKKKKKLYFSGVMALLIFGPFKLISKFSRTLLELGA